MRGHKEKMKKLERRGNERKILTGRGINRSDSSRGQKRSNPRQKDLMGYKMRKGLRTKKPERKSRAQFARHPQEEPEKNWGSSIPSLFSKSGP